MVIDFNILNFKLLLVFVRRGLDTFINILFSRNALASRLNALGIAHLDALVAELNFLLLVLLLIDFDRPVSSPRSIGRLRVCLHSCRLSFVALR